MEEAIDLSFMLLDVCRPRLGINALCIRQTRRKANFISATLSSFNFMVLSTDASVNRHGGQKVSCYKLFSHYFPHLELFKRNLSPHIIHKYVIK